MEMSIYNAAIDQDFSREFSKYVDRIRAISCQKTTMPLKMPKHQKLVRVKSRKIGHKFYV
jgi:hypothetical protein